MDYPWEKDGEAWKRNEYSVGLPCEFEDEQKAFAIAVERFDCDADILTLDPRTAPKKLTFKRAQYIGKLENCPWLDHKVFNQKSRRRSSSQGVFVGIAEEDGQQYVFLAPCRPK